MVGDGAGPRQWVWCGKEGMLLRRNKQSIGPGDPSDEGVMRKSQGHC